MSIKCPHTVVARAVKAGILPKLDGSVPCVDCGRPAAGYDHRDYALPLDVTPVCSACNGKRGRGANHHILQNARPGVRVNFYFKDAKDVLELDRQAKKLGLSRAKFIAKLIDENLPL